LRFKNYQDLGRILWKEVIRVMNKYIKILLGLSVFFVLGGGQVVARGNRGIEKAIESLNRVTQRNENPEAGEQIRSMVQVHEQVQARTETALQQMTQRKAALKLLIGPDYKNAGQVRSDVVGLRNDIRQLTRIQEDSSTEDAGDVQGAIDELEAEANELETQLEEELSGFSLFGWLSRLLANY
jgi:hypothetical protein